MKKNILLLFLLCMLPAGMRAGEYGYLVFTFSDGTTQAVAASDLTVSFSGDNLIASGPSGTLATLPLPQLTQMEFLRDDPTGITALSADTLVYDGSVAVYDMNGRRMPSAASLPRGMYVVKTQNKTVKVHIR